MANSLLVVLAPILVSVGLMQFAIHRVSEGHVGIYWRGGALLKETTEPGFHAKVPFITHFEEVQVTLQTDHVTNIPCGTSGGVLIYFQKVEVVNRLKHDMVYDTVKNYSTAYDKLWIYDKIHHEINQFCSSHSLQEVYIELFDTVDERLKTALQQGCVEYAPGIEIVAIRVTKPKIPDSIQRNYESMEAEKTKLLIAKQHQKVVEKEAETERIRATIEATKNAEVAKIRMEQQMMEKEKKREMSAIEDSIHVQRIRSQADAEFYKLEKQTQANTKLLTKEYLQMALINSITNNTKMFFGEADVSSMLANLMGEAFVSNQLTGSSGSGKKP
eukprot:GFYU01010898.1.p1 GENE.GFYU01010898.1~~GFYU01010898.1.p1  ORF type:complete len:330 (-),score=97.51 GFYU01010898.1:59-1048(-)